MADDTFTCARCGETFEKEWSDEEAWEEYEKNIPTSDQFDSVVVVCDECYEKTLAAGGVIPQPVKGAE